MAVTTINTHKDISVGLVYLAKHCNVLADVIKDVPHVPLRRRPPGFASLASIIISQQVSKQSAQAIFGRMEQFIQPLTAEAYLKAGEQAWIKIGLSRPKQRTFTSLCNAIIEGSLDLDSLDQLPEKEAICAMTSVKGIGAWTAEVYLLFAVGHADIFPAGDLALQIAAASVHGFQSKMSEKELRQLAESWAPYRGVAARLLWAHYAELKNRNAMP